MLTLEATNCPECGAQYGKQHANECKVAQCAECGYMKKECTCRFADKKFKPLPWDGFWPGTQECHKYGLFKATNTDFTNVHCGPDHPLAQYDFHRLRMECIWNKSLGIWIKEVRPTLEQLRTFTLTVKNTEKYKAEPWYDAIIWFLADAVNMKQWNEEWSKAQEGESDE